MYKKCTMCYVEKDITSFNISKKGKFGRSSYCKLCIKEKANQPKQIEMSRKSKSKYYNKNKEKQIEKSKALYRQNPEVVIKRSKLWHENNRERSREINKKYIENNKDKMKKYFNDYQKKLRANPHYRIKKNMSYAIWRGLKENKFGKHWESLINYTTQELINHLESKFTKGMTWEKYGKGGWEIDHIIPQSYFKYDSYNHLAFKACWALSNLQPLWATTEIAIQNGEDCNYIGNIEKGNKINLTQDIKDFLDSVNQISV